MNPYHSLLKLYLIILFFVRLKNCQNTQNYCKTYDTQFDTCIECNDGFYQTSTPSGQQSYCVADCLNILYYSTDKKQCVSSCDYNEIGDSYHRACRDITPCPILNEVGQDFHNGPATSIIINNNFNSNINSRTNENQQNTLITISESDQFIKLWDLTTGELKATLTGHTSSVLKAELRTEKQDLISISSNGEIIFWDYTTGQVKQKYVITTGKFTSMSYIDIEFNRVSLFGFQGELFIYNFFAQENVKYIGHTNLVIKAIFQSEKQIITYSLDKSTIQWNLENNNNGNYQYNVLCNADSIPADIVLLTFAITGDDNNINNKNYSFLFSFGSEGDDSKIVYVTDLMQENKNHSCEKSMLGKLFTDPIKKIISDTSAYSVIIISSIQIIIYGFNFSSNSFQLLQEINQSNPILNLNLDIKGVYLTSNFLLINFEGGRFKTLNYNNPNSPQLQSQQNQQNQLNLLEIVTLSSSSQSNPNKFLQLSRDDVRGILLDQSQNQLYIYGEQIHQINILTQKVNYIINNLVRPYIKETQRVPMLYLNEQQNIIASTSLDGLSLTYDYTTGRLIQQFNHPDYLMATNSPSGVWTVLVQGILLCVAYSDNSVLCYHAVHGTLVYQETFPQKVMKLFTDDVNGYFLLNCLDIIYIVNPYTKTTLYTKEMNGQFYYMNLYKTLVLMTTTIDGNLIRFNYPDLTIQYQTSTKSINPNNQNIVGFAFEPKMDGMSVYYFDAGLWAAYDIKLNLLKYNNEGTRINRCGFTNSVIVTCLTQDGQVTNRGIAFTFNFVQKIFNFPLTDAEVLKKSPNGIFLIDFGIYGGSLFLANSNTLLADQQFLSPYPITRFFPDETKQRLLMANIVGDIMVSHYNPYPSYELKRAESSHINQVFLVKSQQTLVLLSSIITIFDYFSKAILKTNKNHDQIIGVSGITLIEDQNIIISFNSDKQNNLQVWNYNTDQYIMLQGHVSSVNGVEFIPVSNIFISYDSSGIINVWNFPSSTDFSKISKIQTLKQHLNKNIISVFIFDKYSTMLVSFDDQGNLFIINYIENVIKNAITLPNMKQITVDLLNERIFFYGSNIAVYSIISGSKITDLLGFDNNTVQSVLFSNNYIVAYGSVVVQSIQRDSLKLLYSSKFKKDIHQACLLKNVLGMVGNNIDNVVEMWDYTNGVMLSEIKNTIYPSNNIGIIQDEEADLFIIFTVANSMFTLTPFSDSFNQVKDFLFSTMTGSNIQGMLIDSVSNKLIVNNKDQIFIWNYFTYLGYQGQAIMLPSQSLIMSVYHPQQDLIVYADIERNVWFVQNNVISYKQQLEQVPIDLILHKNSFLTIDSNYLRSYNIQFELVSEIKLDCSKIFNNEQIDYIFVQTHDYSLLQYSINPNTSELVYIHTYQQHKERIVNSYFNIQYNHVLTHDISGVLVINNYNTFINIPLPKQHTQVIRDLSINLDLKWLITSSEDKSNRILNYDGQNDITEYKTLIQTTASIQSIIDMRRQEMLIWTDLQQIIQVLDITDKDLKLKTQIKGPADYMIQMKLSNEYNILAVYNQFQVNIHDRGMDDTLINSLRIPSSLQNITDLMFLSEHLMLIQSKASLRLVRFSYNNIITEKIFEMEHPYLLSYNYENSLIMKLKGVNIKTVFNYTFPFFDTNTPGLQADITQIQTYNECYSNLERTSSQYELIQDISLQSSSFDKLNQSVDRIALNIEMDDASDFIFVKSSTNFIMNNKEIEQIYTYNKKENSNNSSSPSEDKERIQLKITQFNDFNKEILTLKNVIWKLINSETYALNSLTKQLIMVNTQFADDIIGSTFILDSLTTFQIDTMEISNISFKKPSTWNNRRNLFTDVGNGGFGGDINFKQNLSFMKVTNSEYVYINNLIIKNIEIESSLILFDLQSINHLIIQNIIIDNISYYFNSGQDIWNSLFQIQDCQKITIYNIQISNIIKQKNKDSQINQKFILFQMKANKYMELFSLQSENNENVKLFDITQSYLQNNKGYFKVIDDQVNFIDIKVSNSQSVDGSAFFYIESDNFFLTNSQFTSLTCQNSYGCAFDFKSTMFNIDSCRFEKNMSLYGGAISVRNSPGDSVISNSKFLSNHASVAAGAIYLDSSNLFITNTIIEKNEAQIGGGIRYLNLIPSFILQEQHILKNQFNNNIQNNVAHLFGQNVGSYPRTMKFLNSNPKFLLSEDKKTKDNQDQIVYILDEYMSGGTLDFDLQIYDEEGGIINLNQIDKQQDEVKKEISQYNLDCVSLSHDITIDGSKAIYDNLTQSYKFNDILIKATPLSSQMFYVQNNMIQVPNPQMNNIQFQDLELQIKIIVQFRQCERGEIFVPSTLNNLSYCLKCPLEKYSLIIPDPNDEKEQVCKLCPESAYHCEGKEIQLKNGYWRENEISDIIVSCTNKPDNCQGEDSNSINNCKEGYIGPLCESCDLFGDVWKQRFMNKGNYQCEKCTSSNSSIIIYSVTLIICSLYLAIGIRSAVKMTILKSQGYYLRMLGIVSIGNSDSSDQSDIYFKLLVHYIQISSIIYQVQMPKLFELLQFSVGTPIDSLKYANDCENLFDRSVIPPVYGRIVWSQFIPLGYILLLLILYQIMYIFKVVKKGNKQILITGFIFMFLFLQPNIISGLVSIISCREIGGQKYISADITLKCYTDDYFNFIGILFLPLFLIWAIIIPSIWLAILFKQKTKLNYCSIRLKYGFLYQEYKSRQFYWEFIKISLKMLIIFINTFFDSQLGIKTTLLTLILFCYLLLSLLKLPYTNISFNHCDQYMNIVLIVCLQLNIFVQSQDNGVFSYVGSILIFIINYALICYLLGQGLKGKLKKYLRIAYIKFPFIRNKFGKLLNYFEVTEVSKMKTFKNWSIAINLIGTYLMKNSKIQTEKQSLLVRSKSLKYNDENNNNNGLKQSNNDQLNSQEIRNKYKSIFFRKQVSLKDQQQATSKFDRQEGMLSPFSRQTSCKESIYSAEKIQDLSQGGKQQTQRETQQYTERLETIASTTNRRLTQMSQVSESEEILDSQNLQIISSPVFLIKKNQSTRLSEYAFQTRSNSKQFSLIPPTSEQL